MLILYMLHVSSQCTCLEACTRAALHVRGATSLTDLLSTEEESIAQVVRMIDCCTRIIHTKEHAFFTVLSSHAFRQLLCKFCQSWVLVYPWLKPFITVSIELIIQTRQRRHRLQELSACLLTLARVPLRKGVGASQVLRDLPCERIQTPTRMVHASLRLRGFLQEHLGVSGILGFLGLRLRDEGFYVGFKVY